VDFGETPEQTAIREVLTSFLFCVHLQTKEEVGLDIIVEKRLGCINCVNVDINYHFVVFFILARMKDYAQEVIVCFKA
jgi:ADP-ribose pyrophosphatase YjhB (NUDIX family)